MARFKLKPETAHGNGNTNQLASATAIWTTNNSRPISSVRSKENFTYVFYTARLANASVSL